MIPNRTKKLLFYAAYICATGFFFIYYLFPSDACMRYVLYHLSRINSDVSANVDRIVPVFPPGLKFKSVRLYYRQNPMIEANAVRITPDIWSLFRPHTGFFLKGDACGGTIEGKVRIENDGKSRRIKFDGDLEGIEFGDIDALKTLYDQKISGNLKGRVAGSISGGLMETMDADFQLSGCKVENQVPLLDLDAFIFHAIDISLSVQQQNIQLKNCMIRGNQLDGSLSGGITIKEPFSESVLNLRGSFRPHPEFTALMQKSLPFDMFQRKRSGTAQMPIGIAGTLGDPRLYLK